MSDQPEMPDKPDQLVQRYREANAHDSARPSTALREAVLARARAQALGTVAQEPERLQRPAANDGAWKIRALGSLAVLGLAGLLMLQFDRGTNEERELALGTTPPRAAPALTEPMAASGSGANTPTATLDEAPATERREMIPVPAASPVEQAARTAPEQSAPPAAKAVAENQASSTALAPATMPARIAQEAAPSAGPASQAADAFPAAPAGRPLGTATFAEGATAPARPAPAAPVGRSESASQPKAMAEDMEQARPTPPATLSRERPQIPQSEAVRRDNAATSTVDVQGFAVSTVANARLIQGARQGELTGVRAALRDGAQPDATDATGRTALMWAAQRGDEALLRLLLDAGARSGKTDRDGRTAADLARAAGHTEAMQMLDRASSPAR